MNFKSFPYSHAICVKRPGRNGLWKSVVLIKYIGVFKYLNRPDAGQRIATIYIALGRERCLAAAGSLP